MKSILAGSLVCTSLALLSGGNVIVESARKIPVAADVDVVVVGGTAEGVAAAWCSRRT